MAETQYYAKSSGYTSDHFYTDSVDGSPHFSGKNGWTTSTGTVIQGSMAKPEVFGSDYNANYYGLMFLKDGAGNNAFDTIRTANINNTPNYIRIRIHSQYSATKTVYLHLGSGVSYNSFASGSRPVDCVGCGAKTLSIPANGWGEITITDAAWLAALASTSAVCLYINHYPSGHSPDSGYYFEGDGALDGSNAFQMFVDWTPRGPRLSDPAIGTIDPIHDNPHAFTCGASADLGGFFTPDQLTYEMQFAPDGSTWGATITSAPGSPSFSVNLKTLLALQATQYYYNTAARIRIRAKTPAWTDGKVYYSHENWADVPQSAPFTIDYRITPSAPSSLSVKRDGVVINSAYEDESGSHITVNIGKPLTCNAQDHLGATMGMTYYAEYGDGSPLASGSANVNMGVAPAFNVLELTTGLDDLPIIIRAKCIDAEGADGRVSPYTADLNFTIKRYRKPAIIVTKIERAETSAKIYIRVTDTGYSNAVSNPQGGGQISKVQYNHDGSYHDAALGTWGGAGGLENSFTISGLASGTRYALSVKAINSIPTGTAIAVGKTSDEYPDLIRSFLPKAYLFNRSSAVDPAAKQGLATQAAIVGDNYDVPVNKGCIAVQNDIDAGGAIRMNGKTCAIADESTPPSGWKPVSDAWAYAGAGVINIPAGGLQKYKKGDRILLKQPRSQAYTNDPIAGSNIVLNMVNTAGFNIGNLITVSSSAGFEQAYITAISANTSITVNALALNHTTTNPLVYIGASTDGTKYFYAIGIADTQLTIFAGSDYTLENAAISSPCYSHIAEPVGFPDAFHWTAVYTGFSSVPASPVNQFTVHGDWCEVTVRNPADGTSNSTVFTISAPVASVNTAVAGFVPDLYNTTALITNSGTRAWGVIEITAANPTVLNLTSTPTGSSFTNSGAKRCNTAGLKYRY